ncbi:MAG: sugar translocase [Paucimonas sp.]|jgi:phosphoglycerol transferase|nr:sugar translocase [Paucimonas sp.]
MSKPQFYQQADILPPSASAVTSFRNSFAFFFLLSTCVLLVAWRSFHLTAETLGVPFTYQEGDVVVVLMHIKGLLQDGWPTTVSHLSAPFVYPAAAFPHMTSTDWLVMKAISFFTSDPGLVLNVFFLFTLVASAWSSAYAAYQLRLSRGVAFGIGVLYAFLPFALIRNVHHLNLVYYLVPLLCLLAVVIAGRGEGIRYPRQATFIGLAACCAQGFDYIYFSYFAALLFGVAALIAWRRGERAALRLPLLAIALICVSTAINLFPAYRSWQAEGKPPEMGYKSIAEAEVYGAKLRRMIAPHPDNPVRPLAKYAKRDNHAGFPIENENVTARLGLFAAFGLLVVLFSLLRTHAVREQPERAVHTLAVVTFLVITVGGLGAVINLVGTPDIRAYNRFSVYLAFLVLAAAGFWLQRRFLSPHRWRRLSAYALAGSFALFSLYDQLLDARFFVAKQGENLTRIKGEKTAVQNLERALPDNAAVLQLPLTGYPPIHVFHQMLSYDHGRPAIWSTRLRWSWPSLTERHRSWQNRLAALRGIAFLEGAALSGFDAIWIDRAAYADSGQKLLADLLHEHVRKIDTGNERYIALDLRAYSATLKTDMGEATFREQAKVLLGNDMLVKWAKGFYDEERNQEGRPFRWVKNKADLIVHNAGDNHAASCISFAVAAPHSGIIEVSGANAPMKIDATAVPQPVRISVHLESGASRRLRFSTGIRRLDAPGDPRELYFFVMDFTMTPQTCRNET